MILYHKDLSKTISSSTLLRFAHVLTPQQRATRIPPVELEKLLTSLIQSSLFPEQSSTSSAASQLGRYCGPSHIDLPSAAYYGTWPKAYRHSALAFIPKAQKKISAFGNYYECITAFIRNIKSSQVENRIFFLLTLRLRRIWESRVAVHSP